MTTINEALKITVPPHAEVPLPEEVTKDFEVMRVLPDGTICGVQRMLFTYAILSGVDATGYSRRWCFTSPGDAMIAIVTWDGTGDPPGAWIRNPETGRRRKYEKGEMEEWVQW